MPSKTTKDFTIVLTNTTNRIARFNFYYVGSLTSNITAGYKTGNGLNNPPPIEGINLQAMGENDSSNTYTITVTNNTTRTQTITLGVSAGLDYNDLSLPDNGHLFEEYQGISASEVLLANVGDNGSTYNDGTDTFITGTNPNNYIWYSGKLWRAMSINNSSDTVKLITQWNISVIPYNSNSSTFKGSYIETWLNDTTVDGFLGNLRNYEDFIVSDATWYTATSTANLGSITKPSSSSTVTQTVGLLNMYEYQTSYIGTTTSNGYLNNELAWWTLTPYNSTNVRNINYYGDGYYYSPSNADGVRPVINLKSSVRIIDGDGTEDNPYRLMGDNDTNLEGIALSTRYSGEYVSFGTGTNNLYRIVSHETEGLTKITSANPIKDSGSFRNSAFGSSVRYSSATTIGRFLNGTYLTSYIGSNYSNMITDSTTWYLGTVGSGGNYRLAKYRDANMSSTTTTTASTKVGLLRLGELMAGQFDTYGNNTSYWTLNPYNTSYVWLTDASGYSYSESPSYTYGIKPAINLKSNVIITSGNGTKNSPFTLKLNS